MDDSVTPMGDRPRLVKRDVKYTQIVVDRVRALNGTIYDVMFIGTGEFCRTPAFGGALILKFF